MHEESMPKDWFKITSAAHMIQFAIDDIVQVDAASALMERDHDSLAKIAHHLNNLEWDLRNSINEHNNARWKSE